VSGYSVRGASVGSDDASTGGANHGEVSLISLGLSGFEAEASRWMARGLCAGPNVDPTWWEVESMHGAGDDPSEAREDRMTEDNKLVKKAQMICRRCPVRQECLDYAMTNGEGWGVWGATTPRMRARIGKWSSRYVGPDGRVPAELRPLEWDGWTWIDERSERRLIKVPVGQGVVVPGRGSQRPEGKCMSGKHDWTPENLIIERDGKKKKGARCRACMNESRRLAARARRLEAREKAGLRYWRTEEFVEEYLKRGLASMSRQEGARSLGMKPDAYGRAVTRARQAGLIQ